ncbi:MAG: oligopeptide transporter, OPT family [FCB group bacterium]|nr:oligopeptide transporter, OPT family [FCB group bacterium]
MGDRHISHQSTNREPNNFQPYVGHDESPAEFTFKSIIAGIIFGILFGAANAYLGLLSGLTVSTSIPVAVMTVGFFRLTRKLIGRGTILESNMSQTIGSASSSLASGVIFTLPALFLWGMEPSIFQMAGLAMLGGLLGILFMIPLRRLLIKQEHGKLPYPEGTACAQVLIASEGGGARASNVFLGVAIGMLYKFMTKCLILWPGKVYFAVPFINKAQLGIRTTPALLGVGYILGIRVATIMVSGGIISWVFLIPLLTYFSGYLQPPWFPEFAVPLQDMAPSDIWNKYIRYIGAGAVAFAGIITIIRSIPTMIASFKIGVGQMRSRNDANSNDLINGSVKTVIPRTDRDLSIKVVVFGALIIIAALALIPGLLGGTASLTMRLVAAPGIALFAFFFVTVSSRIVGLVGVSSNPTSGMTIVTVLGISMIFVMLGWTDAVGQATVLTVGTVVCVASSIAGDTSQDLKTGYLVGATPYRQQIGELVGAATSAVAVCASVVILHKSFGFGTPDLSAPQATLMKTIVEGVLQQGIPWGLILIGVGLGILIELCRLPSLPFAVGLYIPITTTAPIFIGGLIRHVIERRYVDDPEGLARRREKGILFSSGLIGGEGLLMVGVALYVLYFDTPKGIGPVWPEYLGEIVSLVVFTALGYFLYKRTKAE